MLRSIYHSHRSGDGTTVSGRARAAGLLGTQALAENIAKGLFRPDEVVRRWMASTAYRRSILLRGTTDMGVAIALGENQNGLEVL